MSEFFKIYIDRLRNGETDTIKHDFPSHFLDINEKEMQLAESVKVSGNAYLTEEHLVICLKVKTSVLMPCRICNKMIEIPVVIEKFYQTILLKEIRGAIYDYKIDLKEQILLELSHFIECKMECPERTNIKKYMKKELSSNNEETYLPFSDLE